MFERCGQTNTDSNDTPIWVWILFVVSAIIWFVALGLYIADYANEVKQRKIAIACGDIPPPKPEPKIECPKKECVEKKVVECVKKKPCTNKYNVEVDTVIETTNVTDKPPFPVLTPTSSSFSGENLATLKPIASFSPPVAV